MQLTKFAMVFLGALILSGCASGQKSAESTPDSAERKEIVKTNIDLTPEQIEAAKEVIRSELKDPDSAKFSGIYGVTSESWKISHAVCGYVNAKNSYGGYVGKRPFAVVGDHTIMLTDGAFTEFDRRMLGSTCSISN